MDLFGGNPDWRLLAGADSLGGGEEAPQAEPLHLSRTSKYKVSKLDRWAPVGEPLNQSCISVELIFVIYLRIYC
jgi:hypothetical protein